MYIRLIFSIMLIALIEPFALNAQVWTASVETDLATLTHFDKDKDKPIVQSPKQIGEDIQLLWSSNFVRINSNSAFEIRLYESIEDGKGNQMPNLAKKPIVADIVKDRQYQVNGNQLHLRHGQAYCFVIAPTDVLAIQEGILPENATISESIVWQNEEDQSLVYPTCSHPFDLTFSDVQFDNFKIQWKYANPNVIERFDIYIYEGTNLTPLVLAGNTQPISTINNIATYEQELDGLLHNTTYVIRIKAKCSSIDILSDWAGIKGNADGISLVVKTKNPCTLPVFINSADGCGTEVSWQNLNNYALESLVVTRYEGGTPYIIHEIPYGALANRSSYVFNDLLENQTYTFTLNYTCPYNGRTVNVKLELSDNIVQGCTNPKIASLDACQVSLNWQNPNNVNCRRIIVINPDNSAENQEIDLTGLNVTNFFQINDLNEEKLYGFELIYDCDGENEKSLIFPNVTIPKSCQKPIVSSIEEVANNRVKINYDGDLDLSVCYLGVGGANSSGGSVLYKKDGTIPNLQPSASYTFYIAYAGCPNNCTLQQNCTKSEVQDIQFTMPCARPNFIYYKNISSQSIKIAWEEALPANVEYRELGTSAWIGPVFATGSLELNNVLTPNTDYEFKVSYDNCSNSLVAVFKTLDGDACLGNPLKAEVTYSKITKNSIQFNIKPFGFNNEYECEYQDVDSNSPWEVGNLLNEANSFTLSSLTAGTTYNIRIRRLVVGNDPTPCTWLELNSVTTEELVCPLFVFSDFVYETSDDYIKITLKDEKLPHSYNVRYKIEGTSEWKTIKTTGLIVTINELLNNTTYEIEIQRACNDSNSGWVALDKQKTKTKKITTLPEPDCGQVVKEPTVPADLTIIPPIDELSKGSIFYFYGFEIKVTEFSNGESTVITGPFSGKGEMGLPFGKKKIKVNFANMNVNKFQLGTGGSITAVSDHTLNIQGGTVALNTFTCDPPPVKVKQNADGTYGDPPRADDPHGFDKDGKYIGSLPNCLGSGDQKDPMRDPRGFDKAGNYIGGGLYDKNGCDINGLKANKQPCDCYKPCDCKDIKPYAWLNDNSAVTNEGNVFAEAQKVQINNWIPIILDSLKGNLEQQIGKFVTDCDALRAPMQTQLTTLGYNRPLTFGANDKYFNEKMSAEFNKTPVALKGITERKTGADVFEKNHIDLYTCDLKLADARAFKDIVDFFYSTPTEREKIESYVYEKVRRLPKEKVTEFVSEKKFKVWVVAQVMEFLKNEFRTKYSRDFGYVEPQIIRNSEPGFPPLEKPWIPPYEKGLANTDLSYQMLKDATTNDLNDAVFQYEQGFEYINGMHRTVFYEAIAKAREQMEMVDDAQAMPISFDKTIAGVTYTMYLDNFAFNGGTASIDAYLVITLKDGQRVVFEGKNLAFNRGGLITTANSGPKLFLLTDVAYGINRVARITLKGKDNQTYVEWDCEGFRSLHTQVDVEFCRQYMKPLDNSGKVIADPTKMVTLSTALDMASWGEFEIAIANNQEMNFVMTGYEDYKINVKQILIDNSTTKTHNPSITFPSNYGSKDVEIQGTAPTATAHALPTWKGIYIGGIKVKMPSDVIKSKNGQVEVGVEKMIIDNEGVTGVIYAKPGQAIVPIDDGDLDGWAYSVEGIHLNVMQNHIVGGGFDGLLNIPILSHKSKTSKTPKITKEDCFHYRADYIVGQNKFTFTVKPESEKEFKIDMLKAKVTLNQNSRVDLVFQNNIFTATAVLHGTIGMSGQLDPNKPKRNLGAFSIGFSDLTISNKAPRFKGGRFEMPKDPQLFKKYGLTYHTGAVRSSVSNDKIAIMDLDVDFHLSRGKDVTVSGGTTTEGEDPTKLAAHGGFEIRGIMENDASGRQRFVYDNFVVKSVEVNGSFPGVEKIHGYIKFFEEGDMIDGKLVDPRFGEGFQGGLDVKFDKLGFQAQAVGLFGTVNDYKYFCVDAMIYKDGLFNIAGVMDVNGFGGGAYYHMSRDTAVVNNFNFTLDKDTPIPTTIGESLTGIKYAPDNEKLIGIRAMLAFSLAKAETAVNGNVLFGVEFNKNFGLSEVMLAGNANIMTPIASSALPKFVKDKGDPKTAKIRASVVLVLKFGEKTQFDCNTNVYMNVGGLLVGNSDPTSYPDLMGGLQIHVEKGLWYFYLGTPSSPVKLSLQIPNIPQVGISLSTYMDIGSQIPDMPPLPSFIQQATGAGYKIPKASSRNSGAGFAFGANLSINTGDKTFLIFYGKFQAELGFDVMLKNYGATTTCSNLGNRPIGMDGWYATGQMYAGVQAELGLKWKNTKFPIMNIYAAVALQAKMPNPFWAQGSVGGYYSILGGLKKGSCNFQMTIGQECELPVGSDPNLLVAKESIVQSINPSDNEEAFPVLSSPTIEMNYPLNEVIEDDDTGLKYLTQFIEDPVLKTKDGYTIPCKKELDLSGAKLELQPYSILDGNTEMVLTFRIVMKENGVEKLNESKEVHFKTAAAEMTLPRSNIVSTYPQDGQYNFYIKENEVQKGYIYLRLGQPYLFRSTEGGKDIVHKMRFTSKSGNCFMTNIEYKNTIGEPLITVDMPAAKFTKGEIYRMDLITFAKADDGTACVPDTKIIRNLYTAYFRTSTYDKVADKINAAFGNQVQVNLNAPSYDVLLSKANLVEPFDQFEITNSGKLQSSFKFTIDYLKKLPPTLTAALNNVTGKEPYIVKFEISSGNTKEYPLTLDFSQVSGVVSGANSNRALKEVGQRAVGDITYGTTGSSIPTYLRVIQDKEKLPYIKASDFSGTLTPFTEPQYLRFDAINGTWEQVTALKKGIMNLKEDIVQDLIAAGEFLHSEKADAFDFVDNMLGDSDHIKYNWINWIDSYPVNRQQTDKIPSTATYTPATRNLPSSTIEFNK